MDLEAARDDAGYAEVEGRVAIGVEKGRLVCSWSRERERRPPLTY